MVYSRATTSEMAERDFFGAVFLGWVFGLSLTILPVFYAIKGQYCGSLGVL
jgi:hypothetical protein